MIFIAAHISRAYKTLCATVIVAKIKITNVDSYIVSAIISILAVLVLNFFWCVLQTRWNDFRALASSRLKTAMPSLDFATCNLLLHVYDI